MSKTLVNRADDPVRTLSDQVGGRIAAGLAGQPRGEAVALKRGAIKVQASGSLGVSAQCRLTACVR